jgi:hypothetical protein
MNDTFKVFIVVALLAGGLIWRTEAAAKPELIPAQAWDATQRVAQELGQAYQNQGATTQEQTPTPAPVAVQDGPSAPTPPGVPPVLDPFAYDPTAGGYAYAGSPSIPLATFQGVLREAGSPYVPESEAMYAVLVHGGIDPTLWLAHAIKEGEAGRTGTARPWTGDVYAGLNNPGGVRKTISGIQIGVTPYNMGIYASYTDSVRDWVWLFTTQGTYLDAGLQTIDQVVPVYAPVTENNTTGYIQDMHVLVDGLRARVDRTNPPTNTDPFRAP